MLGAAVTAVAATRIGKNSDSCIMNEVISQMYENDEEDCVSSTGV